MYNIYYYGIKGLIYMKPFKKISVSDLKPGMVTAQDFVINNTNLITKNYLMDMAVINKLNLNYAAYDIYVYCPENSSPHYKEKKRFEALQNSLNDISSCIEETFTFANEKQSISIDQIRSISNDIISLLDSKNNIVKCINLPRDFKKYLYTHSTNVALLSMLIAQWMKLDQKTVSLICHSAMLHDIGKTAIPISILEKKGPLTKSEFKLCETHALKGYEIVKNTPFINPAILQGILFHHERLDGTGYPMHLKEDKIPNFARIIAVADTFDAITSNHAYKQKTSPLHALATIKDCSLNKLDPLICHILIMNIAKFYEGQSIILSNDRIGELIKINMDNLLYPIICVDNEVIDLSKNHSLSIKDFV
ncbi:HD family phosphohydrolase [Clostridium sp. TW13]|uniref:HD family phosphohydrolase n=1 Tax=Inconstantimicrobium mannanitabidum TaxID=1604901 RepID=A0ACB5RHZ7_9CLOT|nr:HD family phosphohydrolase [Clostridium sp. TW13]